MVALAPNVPEARWNVARSRLSLAEVGAIAVRPIASETGESSPASNSIATCTALNWTSVMDVSVTSARTTSPTRKVVVAALTLVTATAMVTGQSVVGVAIVVAQVVGLGASRVPTTDRARHFQGATTGVRTSVGDAVKAGGAVGAPATVAVCDCGAMVGDALAVGTSVVVIGDALAVGTSVAMIGDAFAAGVVTTDVGVAAGVGVVIAPVADASVTLVPNAQPSAMATSDPCATRRGIGTARRLMVVNPSECVRGGRQGFCRDSSCRLSVASPSARTSRRFLRIFSSMCRQCRCQTRVTYPVGCPKSGASAISGTNLGLCRRGVATVGPDVSGVP